MEDEEVALYKVKRNVKISGDLTLKRGTHVQLVNNTPNEYGTISIKIVEGENSDKRIGVSPGDIELTD